MWKSQKGKIQTQLSSLSSDLLIEHNTEPNFIIFCVLCGFLHFGVSFSVNFNIVLFLAVILSECSTCCIIVTCHIGNAKVGVCLSTSTLVKCVTIPPKLKLSEGEKFQVKSFMSVKLVRTFLTKH